MRGLLDFLRDENGSITIMSLTWIPLTLMIGGLALDTANAMMVRTQLQTVADAAAHAALFTRETGTAEDAHEAARGIVAGSLPAERHGDVIRDGDIQFGTWDPATQAFTPDPASKSAVRVDLARVAERSNPVGTWLLRLAGLDAWDIHRVAVFETWRPGCLNEGFVARGVVDLRSNNYFTNGFCIHSNDHVELQQNNAFEEGVIVSMPDSGTIVLPASGFDKNEGLEAALRDGSYNIRMLNRLPDIIAGVGTYGSNEMPDYIDAAGIVTLDKSNLSPTDFTPGRIHRKVCGGAGTLSISAGAITDAVLITDCAVQFVDTTLDNTIVATTSTDAKSVKSSSGLQIGRDDDCATDGGAVVLTLGGIDIAANLSLFGGQIVAGGDIQFSANADGIEGASLIAGGGISGTSNMTMGLCGGGMERNFELDYFRLAY